MSIKKLIQNGISSYKDRRFRNQCRKNDSWILSAYNLPKLSKDELQIIRSTWPCFDIKDEDLTYLKMYKYLYGFDPYFITDYYYQFILDKTNKPKEVYPFTNKAMYDVYMPRIPAPHTYSRVFGDGVNNLNMSSLSREKEIDILMNAGTFIIKPAKDSGCGDGVKKVDVRDHENAKDYLRELLESYGINYITQEVIRQHPLIAELNPSSLNTCRITTIYLNGRITHSGSIKIGKLNSNVDNWHSSYFIGLNDKGIINDIGYDNRLKKVNKTDNGIIFGGREVPYYDDMVQLVESLHKYYFPNLGICGWDVCVDEDDKIRVVEVNVDYPGIVAEQIGSGTFFKERCEEINQLILS